MPIGWWQRTRTAADLVEEKERLKVKRGALPVPQPRAHLHGGARLLSDGRGIAEVCVCVCERVDACASETQRLK